LAVDLRRLPGRGAADAIAEADFPRSAVAAGQNGVRAHVRSVVFPRGLWCFRIDKAGQRRPLRLRRDKLDRVNPLVGVDQQGTGQAAVSRLDVEMSCPGIARAADGRDDYPANRIAGSEVLDDLAGLQCHVARLQRRAHHGRLALSEGPKDNATWPACRPLETVAPTCRLGCGDLLFGVQRR